MYKFYMFAIGTHQRALNLGRYSARYIQRIIWAKYEFFEYKDSSIIVKIPNRIV